MKHTMPQCTVIRVNGRLGVYSWTSGFKETPVPKPKTEDDFIRLLVWMEKSGRGEEADLLLQQYCGK